MKLNFRKLGSGPPVIILHGLYGSGDNWYTIARKLADYHTVYLPDQRNHGGSPHHYDFNYEILCNDLDEFIQQEKIIQPSIVGHSMGGKVAMYYAQKKEASINKLIVIDIALRNYAEKGSFAPQALMHQQIIDTLSGLNLNVSTRSEIDGQLSKVVESVSTRQFLLKNIRRSEDGRFFWKINLLALQDNLESLLDNVAIPGKTIKNPTLIVRGSKSGYIDEKDIQQFYAIFNNVRIADLDSGHWVHAEQPDKLIELMLSFLSH